MFTFILVVSLTIAWWILFFKTVRVEIWKDKETHEWCKKGGHK
jgi:hypothetical protein